METEMQVNAETGNVFNLLILPQQNTGQEVLLEGDLPLEDSVIPSFNATAFKRSRSPWPVGESLGHDKPQI